MPRRIISSSSSDSGRSPFSTRDSTAALHSSFFASSFCFSPACSLSRVRYLPISASRLMIVSCFIVWYILFENSTTTFLNVNRNISEMFHAFVYLSFLFYIGFEEHLADIGFHPKLEVEWTGYSSGKPYIRFHRTDVGRSVSRQTCAKHVQCITHFCCRVA